MTRWIGFLLLLASLGVLTVAITSDSPTGIEHVPLNPDGNLPPVSPPPQPETIPAAQS